MQAKPSININEPSRRFAASNAAIEVLDHLNERTCRKYRPVKANLALIEARFKDGATIEDCKAVIDAKVDKWFADAKMSQYLRPATLFNPVKFAQYAGEIDSASALVGGESWE